MKNFVKPLLLILAVVTLSVTNVKAQTINGILQADPASLEFETTVGTPVTEVVNLLVLNQEELSRLTSPLLDVRIEGTDADQYSIDANTVTIIDILESIITGKPVDIEVTYNPTETGTHFATLVIGLPRILGLNIVLANVELTGTAN